MALNLPVRQLARSTEATLNAAWSHSEGLLAKARPIIAESIAGGDLDTADMCFAAVGSTARREAMNASDIDLIPIWNGDPKAFPHFEDLSGKVREDLRRAMNLDVSTARDLMRSTQLSALCKPDGIGGDLDHRRTLTQRMLVLTESAQLGGALGIETVRRKIFEAYVGDRDTERTVSRHPLAVCNDIARYYRTLCVDYKSRAETKPQSWAERHAKLRNARKVWYFSTLLALSKHVVDLKSQEHSALFDALAATFSKPPIERLISAAVGDAAPFAWQVLDLYAPYLEQMSCPDFRASLNDVTFEEREQENLTSGKPNPYREMHERSREMSSVMVKMMLASDENVRDKVYNWFLL